MLRTSTAIGKIRLGSCVGEVAFPRWSHIVYSFNFKVNLYNPINCTQQTEQLYTYTMHRNKKSIFLPLNIKHTLIKIVNVVTNQL